MILPPTWSLASKSAKGQHLLDRTSRSILSCCFNEAFSEVTSDRLSTSVLLVLVRSVILHTCACFLSVMHQDMQQRAFVDYTLSSYDCHAGTLCNSRYAAKPGRISSALVLGDAELPLEGRDEPLVGDLAARRPGVLHLPDQLGPLGLLVERHGLRTCEAL